MENTPKPDLGLYKLVLKTGRSIEVYAISPEHAVKVLSLILNLPEITIWNGLEEIHIIKEPNEVEH